MSPVRGARRGGDIGQGRDFGVPGQRRDKAAIPLTDDNDDAYR
jgi:hypothetical protein